MRKTFAALVSVVCLFASIALAEAFPPSSTPTLPGVDVSSWQRVIDWTQVRASGVEIAILRASEGDSFTDPYFAANYEGARAAGIRVGFYHYLTARTTEEAVMQADYFAQVIAGKTPDCLLALDYGGGGTLSDDQLTACALAFLGRVRARTGYGVMLYTDAWAAKSRYGRELAQYPIWVANYGVSSPEPNGKWSAWVGFQYSDRGRVPGIDGYVDLDQFTAQVLQGGSPTPTPTPTPPADSETLAYQSVRALSVAEAAALLGTTEQALRSLNEVVGGAIQAGQVARYPSSVPSSGESFAGLHVLQADESLRTLAGRYQTTAEQLAARNAFPNVSVPTGQIVRLPVAPGRTDVPAPPSWLLENVVVLQPGQTLEALATLYGIPAATLYTVNGLTPGAPVYAGQLIHLQAYGNDENPAFRGGYVVQRGDSLVRIARRFGATAEALYQLNNIAHIRLIYPGQILLLPER